MKKLKLIFLFMIICGFVAPVLAQINKPDVYLDPYVRNRFVRENNFLNKIYTPQDLPGFEEARERLPQPYWNNHQDFIDCYWKTWQIAFGNLRQPGPESGFVSNYVTTQFNNHVFMWGHVFMLMYWKYALQIFPYQESLENFYSAQHPDGFISREISEQDGTEMFHRNDLSSTGPNIFPWAEWAYYEISGDKERLAAVFPVLMANKQWVMKYRTWKDGTYYASGWSSGMDNQPRMQRGYSPQFDHGHMSWIDITLQQIFMDQLLLKMAKELEREADVGDIREELDKLQKVVNEEMWNEDIQFYVDRFRDGSLSDAKSIGAYWSLLAGIVPPERLDGFLYHLSNSSEFNRPHRIPSISADTPGYQKDGDYWRGGVWGITNLMVLQGLIREGRDSLAHEIAMNHLSNVVDKYKATGTIWENYAPEPGVEPRNTRPDFVGFSGVSPVAIFFENVLGIRSYIPEKLIVWDVRLLEEHGIRQYPIGLEGLVDLECESRNTVEEEPRVNITSSVPVTVVVKWKGGVKTLEIKPE